MDVVGIAPSVLRHFGASPPERMQGPPSITELRAA
jgi:hypothetical protein